MLAAKKLVWLFLVSQYSDAFRIPLWIDTLIDNASRMNVMVPRIETTSSDSEKATPPKMTENES